MLSSEYQADSNEGTRCAKSIGTVPWKFDFLIIILALASLLSKLFRLLFVAVISWVFRRINVFAVTIVIAVHFFFLYFVLIVLTSTVILLILVASTLMMTRSFASLVVFSVRVFNIRSVSAVSVLVVTVIRVAISHVTIGSVRIIGMVGIVRSLGPVVKVFSFPPVLLLLVSLELGFSHMLFTQMFSLTIVEVRVVSLENVIRVEVVGLSTIMHFLFGELLS